MTAREVYDHTVQKGLYDFKAKQPIHVVASQMRKHCVGRDARSYAGSKFFERVGKDKYRLLLSPVIERSSGESGQPRSLQPVSNPSAEGIRNVSGEGQRIALAKKTILLAIKEVMEDHGKQMSPQQVYEAIVSRELYSFKATQPIHVVRSQIRRHCVDLDFPSASDLKVFAIRGKDRYYLLPKPVRQKSKLTGAVGADRQKIIESETSSDSGQTQRDQVFISYSHKDARWLQRLQVHLRPLEKGGLIDSWDDTRIKPGAKWRIEIAKAMGRARVAVLLISADFLASEFILDDELPPLLHAAASQGVMILPVIVSPCRFEKTKSLSQFQSVNPPTKPLSKLDTTKREEVFCQVTDAVEAALYPL